MMYVHELVNYLTTHSVRARVDDKSKDRMIPVPLVVIIRDSLGRKARVALPVTEVQFHPHSPRVTDAETGDEIKPEEEAELCLYVDLPEDRVIGYRPTKTFKPTDPAQ